MVPSKKIEIITASSAEEIVIETLEKVGLTHYTLIDRVQGSGKRGKRADDDFMDIMHNCLFIILCNEEEAESTLSPFQKIVREFGGIIMVSDCLAFQ